MDNPTDFERSEYTELTLEDIFRMFRKHRLLFVGVIIAAVALTGLYLFFATPIFEASVTVKVEPTSKSSMSDIFMDQVTGSYSSKDISTEVELIKSRSNFEKVIADLGLVDRMIEPEVKSKMLQEGYTEEDIIDSLAKTLSDIVTVSPVKDTRIVKISVQHANPELATDIANKLAEVYNEKLADLSKRDVRTKREFIESQIPIIEADLRKATDALKEFKETYKIYVLEEHARSLLQILSKYDQQYNDLSLQLNEKQAEKDAYLQLLKEFESSEAEARVSKWIKTSESFTNPVIAQLKSKRADLEIELAALKQQYPTTDPKVQAKLTEIAKTDELIKKETENFIRTGESQTLNPAYEEALINYIGSTSSIQVLESRLQAVEKIKQGYEKQLAQLPELEQRLLELQRQVTVKENLYTLMLEKLEEAKISEAAVVGNAAVVDYAKPPRIPVKPNKKLSLAIGGVLGIFLGMLTVFLVEYTDKTLKSEEEIERYSGLNVIGRIPEIEDLTENEDELYVRSHPTAPQSEAIKLAASNISFLIGDEKKAIAMTSVSPSEGKSFVAANTAFYLASSGYKTILIDLDLRRPRVEKILKLDSKKTDGKGITDLIKGEVDLNQVIVKNYDENLDVIPVGSRATNPTLLLSSKTLEAILDQLKERYDRIVVDTPPALVTSDVSLIASKLDGIVLVVKPGIALKDGLRITINNLRTVGAPLLGVLVNGVNQHTSGYYHYYYYYYGEKGKKKKRGHKEEQQV
ncbi:capsular biosynthesis protein [Kosmotoga arenicorallina S304]|uniref:non-specific protein-tyrosine kinase n=1 Tax=Kosmotoga arenicorallina S304 TaxID=1453497 RepID=A0A182C824_9BACT|nr:polysaccharide biosynthesis tyrosine autokinase [Kosmotoga arenicorallina]OAA31906.1 capsular biosynthesis protein [Kosmotoga arenicorallina S304]